MKIRDTKRERDTVYGYLLSLTTMAVTVVVFTIVTTNLAGRAGGREEEILKKAVMRTSVQCCATEGRHPSNAGYLEENYGVQTNRKKYDVFYDDFTPGAIPEINIIPIEEQGATE